MALFAAAADGRTRTVEVQGRRNKLLSDSQFMSSQSRQSVCATKAERVIVRKREGQRWQKTRKVQSKGFNSFAVKKRED